MDPIYTAFSFISHTHKPQQIPINPVPCKLTFEYILDSLYEQVPSTRPWTRYMPNCNTWRPKPRSTCVNAPLKQLHFWSWALILRRSYQYSLCVANIEFPSKSKYFPKLILELSKSPSSPASVQKSRTQHHSWESYAMHNYVYLSNTAGHHRTQSSYGHTRFHMAKLISVGIFL